MAARSKPVPRGLDLPPSVQLANQLKRQYGQLNKAAMKVLRRVLPQVVAGAMTLEQALAQVQAAADRALPDNTIRSEAEAAANRGNAYNSRHFFAGVGAVAGIQLLGGDGPGGRLVNVPRPRIKPLSKTLTRRPRFAVKMNFQPSILINQFVDTNVRLISTLRAGVSAGVGDAIARAQFFGTETPEDVTKRLLLLWEKEGVPSQIPIRRLKQNGEPVTLSALKHAAFVARDQLEKLNGQLTETRQVAAGIEEFIWVTRGDNKVRPKHAALNGKKFSWAEGANGLLPGQAPNCRCRAKAVVVPSQVITNGAFIDIDRPETRGTIFSSRGTAGRGQAA